MPRGLTQHQWLDAHGVGNNGPETTLIGAHIGPDEAGLLKLVSEVRWAGERYVHIGTYGVVHGGPETIVTGPGRAC